MMFEKHRFEIWNMTQHPYKHSLEEFFYANSAAPNTSNVKSALDWIFAVIYPYAKDSVDTKGDLPAVGNDINDYRVVKDDGDGKAASYRWEQREGDASPKWYKIYDMDWGEESILSNFLNKTQDVYFYKYGIDDLDSDGNVLAGDLAGQHAYGGQSANTHMNLHANSGDGVGANTGFIQFFDNVRPYTDNNLSLGTNSNRFQNGYFGTSLEVANLTFTAGSVMSSSGQISFNDENLITTGNISGNQFNVDSHFVMQEIATPANPAVGYNSLYFKNDDKLYRLDSLGNEALVGLEFTSTNDNRVVRSDGTTGSAIQESGLILNDLDELSGVTRLDVDNIRIDGNTILSTDVNGDINLTPNGTGFTIISNAQLLGLTDERLLYTSSSVVVSSDIEINGLDELLGASRLTVDNLQLDGNTFSTTDLNGNLILSPNGTGVVSHTKSILPSIDDTLNLGSSSLTYNDIFLKGNLRNDTLSVTIDTLLSFRDALIGANDGDVLFYNSATSRYLPSAPDSEIDHGTLSGLADDNHTQYLLLAGRTGGQDVIGGVDASDNLTLESTSNATKGKILFKDNLSPFTDASYSAGWLGTDLGASTNYLRHVYSKGEFFGFRLENTTSGTLPSSSANNVGRLVFATDNGKIYVDTGTQFKVAGVSKHIEDLTFNGVDLTKDVDVSANIVDARNAVIQLKDNSNNFENLYVVIKATSASNVRIETSIPLPAGTYRLIVME